jgi:uncharacterized membrane protein
MIIVKSLKPLSFMLQSQANIGGASAPIVAAAFSPFLAP